MGLEILSQHGVCVALHVSYPRYRDQLDPTVLGFDLRNETDKAVFKAPSIALLAEAVKPISRIEQQARLLFGAKTLSMGASVGLRFCPAKGLAGLMDGLEEKSAEFHEAAAQFVANFPTTLSKLETDWKQTIDRQTNFSEEIRSKILTQITSKLPRTPPNLGSFSMSTDYLELRTPETPGFSNLEAAEAAVAAEAWAKMQANAAQRAKSMSDNFISGCRNELLGRLGEFFGNLNKLVEEGSPINKRTVRKVQEFISTIDTLNFMRDNQINELMTGLQASFGDHLAIGEGVKDEDIVKSVKNCVAGAVDRIEMELSVMYDDGGMDRMAAIAGTSVPEQTPGQPFEVTI